MPHVSIDAVKALYSTDPYDLNYDEWRNVSCAFRQSATGLGVDDAIIRMTWDGWCAQYGKNSHADNENFGDRWTMAQSLVGHICAAMHRRMYRAN